MSSVTNAAPPSSIGHPARNRASPKPRRRRRRPAVSPAVRRANLLRRIRARYQTITERLTVGSLELNFTRIADPNRVLDEVAEEEDRLEKVTGVRVDGDYLHLPYWAELWDSAAGVGEFLVRRWGDGVMGRWGEVES